MPDTVKIGCRIASGLRLRVYDFQDGPDGTMPVEVGMIELAGSGGAASSGDALSADSDAVYTDADAGLWEKWLAFNKDSDLVANRAVFKGNATAKTPPKAPDGGAAVPAALSDASAPAKAS